MNIYHIREKTMQLGEEIDEKNKQLKELLTELQDKCPHPPFHILQTPFRSGFIADEQQLRLCSVCGKQDEGWQFYKLGVPYDRKDEIKMTTRKELFRVRQEILRGTRVGID